MNLTLFRDPLGHINPAPQAFRLEIPVRRVREFLNSQGEFVWAWRENSSDANGQVAAFGLQVWTAAACPALPQNQIERIVLERTGSNMTTA